MTAKDAGMFCSFCGMNQGAVRKLIAGGGQVPSIPGRRPERTLAQVFICDECVDLCNEIIAASPPKK
jgi:hypothetical protein